MRLCDLTGAPSLRLTDKRRHCLIVKNCRIVRAGQEFSGPESSLALKSIIIER
jgi:hypothetical protein